MILIPTTVSHGLQFPISAEQILLSDLTHLVIDEADTLFDHSFVEATTSIIRNIEVCAQSTQYMTVSHSQSKYEFPALFWPGSSFTQVRSKKPPLPPDMGEGAQVTIVGATLSNKMLQKIQKLIPVCSYPVHV